MSKVAKEFGIYVCPVCQASFAPGRRCGSLSHEELYEMGGPVVRRMRFIDRMARIYETRVVVSESF
jgi:hypothetical protein